MSGAENSDRPISLQAEFTLARHADLEAIGVEQKNVGVEVAASERPFDGGGRGAARIRTGDVGFAIRCLSHLATAP